MHDFGPTVNLKGKHVVFKKTSFYRPGANRNTRTFVVDSGQGCEATKGTPRTLTGYWLTDGTRDTINSYELEFYIDENGNDIPNPGAKVLDSFSE